MLAQKGQGGLYAGPTSMVTHFLSVKSASNEGRDGEGGSNRPPFDSADESVDAIQEQPRLQYDDDLLTLLPPLHIIDGLVDYYFEYCNWNYRHVHPRTFQNAWARFKSGYSADRLVLATLCVVMGVAIRYLPDRHALLTSLPHTHEELGERYYEICQNALARYRSECRTLSLELIECLLIRTHYLTLSKDKSEEIYAIRGELVSIGTAMGLHRDPDKWHMPRDVAERRRWAWWHIILLERSAHLKFRGQCAFRSHECPSWQCFLFGRPPSVSCHHWDTSLPSNVDHDSDPADRRSFEPNLHLFRLAHVLCDIVDDAVSIRPVSYDRVVERDRQLISWMEALPKELDLDEFRVARALASPIPSTMRLGVQSIIIRCSYYHIRFTLHRPYAAAAHDLDSLHDRQPSSAKSFAGGSNALMDERMAQSLDTAVNAADKLIQLSAQAQPDRFANSSLTVPGHIHWLPFHCFSAAMFFSFQLIANPDQPGANLFRANIRRVLELLSISQGVVLADKASAILNALAPLYESPPPGETEAEREKKKKTVLAIVRGLAFPYHDSPVHARQSGDSPSTYSRRHLDSPSQVNIPPHTMVSPVTPHVNGSPTHHVHLSQQRLDMVSSPVNQHPSQIGGYSHESMPTQQSLHHSMPPMSQSHQTSPPPPTMHHHHPTPVTPHHPSAGMNGNGVQYPSQVQSRSHYAPAVSMQPPEYSDAVPYPQTSDEMTMQLWGASVGFGQGEWARFIDSMQRPVENSRSI